VANAKGPAAVVSYGGGCERNAAAHALPVTAQRKQYESCRYFDVIGGDTDKFYRIRRISVMNVDEPDHAGRRRWVGSLSLHAPAGAIAQLRRVFATGFQVFYALACHRAFLGPGSEPMVMSILRLGCLFALGFTGVAFAQQPTDQEAINKRVAEWLKTCLSDWDRSTHMNNREWRATCERVASERAKFLLEHPDASSVFLEGTKGRPKH
jgi:hypothetical protein